MLLFSRSSTSSLIAKAICNAVSFLGWSSLTKDHCKIVIGPVNIPLTIFFVCCCANFDHCTVIDSGRETSPNIIGGFTHRDP